MELTANTRRAALTRLALGAVVTPLSAFVAVLHLGGASPFGLVATIPAGYLLWAWVEDVWTLLRSTKKPLTFKARPRYLAMLLAGVLCFLFWHSVFWR